jgi:CRP-like cAMP-binding protein
LAHIAAPLRAPVNRLLAALPAEDLAALWPRLEPVVLTEHQALHRHFEPIKSVYFPESGWFSLLVTLADGGSAEVGIVGREGMVGLPVLLGTDDAELNVMIQAPGTALRLGNAAFREELDRSPFFRKLLLRYVLARHVQSTQFAACNARHNVDQRLARKLLMMHDRANGDDFPITHESLAIVLGVRRAGVTVAAGQLQRAGLIRYTAGHITITNRPGLEAVACECYGVIQSAYSRLLAPGEANAAERR